MTASATPSVPVFQPPRSQRPSALPEPSLVSHVAGMPHPRRILVVDDEHLAAVSLMQSLRALGYEPLGPARDGAHAVQLAFFMQPDLALLDVCMATDQDGIDAAAALYGEMAVPVVIVSAYSSPELTEGASNAGVFGYLVKPTTTGQLRAAIDVAWARYSALLEAELENADLFRRLDERKTIERAKWSLVERLSLDEGQAMERMRARSHEEHRSLIEIARDILRE
jgi:two-component system, response regulator PdtaR